MTTASFEPQWRTKPFLERLAYSYTNQLFVDAELMFDFVGKHYSFKAHKNILAYYSTVLEEHFYIRNREDILSTIDPNGLRLVLELLYKVPVSFVSADDRSLILSAYHAAKTLNIRSIERSIKEEIFNDTINSKFLSAEDFWKFLELSRVLKLKDVTYALLSYAKFNAKDILSARSLEIASFSTVQEVLELDELLEVPEIEVLRNVARWYYANANGPYAKDFIRDLLACVRFRNISVKDFKDFTKANWGIIKDKDVVQIIMHLELPVSCSLPSWCHKSFRRSAGSMVSSCTKQKSTNLTDEIEEVKKYDITATTAEKNMKGTILDMYAKELFTDVCFLVGEETIPVKAHRNILALGSPVFEKMFYGPLADSRRKIEITTQFPEGFKLMIKYFYDDTDPDSLFKDSKLACMTFDVALKYGSQALRNACTFFLKPGALNFNTFWSHLSYRLNLGTESGNRAVLQLFPKFATSSAKDLFKHITLLNASEEAIIFVLELDGLKAKQINILEGVARWIEFDPINRSKTVLLRYIKFIDISLNDFMSFLKKHKDILSSEEALQILHHIHDKTSPLPKWCNQNMTKSSRILSGSKDVKNKQMNVDIPKNNNFVQGILKALEDPEVKDFISLIQM